MIVSEKILEFFKETVGTLEPEMLEVALEDLDTTFNVFHQFEMFEREGDDDDVDLWQSEVFDVSSIMDRVLALDSGQKIYQVMISSDDMPSYEGYLSVWFAGTSEDDIIARLQVAWDKYQANESRVGLRFY
jgi:hypothetical protein